MLAIRIWRTDVSHKINWRRKVPGLIKNSPLTLPGYYAIAAKQNPIIGIE